MMRWTIIMVSLFQIDLFPCPKKWSFGGCFIYCHLLRFRQFFHAGAFIQQFDAASEVAVSQICLEFISFTYILWTIQVGCRKVKLKILV